MQATICAQSSQQSCYILGCKIKVSPKFNYKPDEAMGIQSECIFAMVHLPQDSNFLSPPSLLTVISKRDLLIYRLHELM